MQYKKTTISILLTSIVLVGVFYGWTQYQQRRALATPAEQVIALGVKMGADQASEVAMMRLVKAGHPVALRIVAKDWHLRGDAASQVQALAMYQRAAQAGDEIARYELAIMLLQGNQIKADPIQARALLQALPAMPAAQMQLGQLMLRGVGGVKDEAGARVFIEKAAQGGDREALYTLGNWYRYGEGRAIDIAQAVKSYQAAASRQYAPALQELAMAYEIGDLGLPINPERSSFLRNMALHIATCKDSHIGVVKMFN